MADIFLPKWKTEGKGNGTKFMQNLDRYLRYEVDLEKHEASMREAMARKENEEMGVAKTEGLGQITFDDICLLYTSPSPRDS